MKSAQSCECSFSKVLATDGCVQCAVYPPGFAVQASRSTTACLSGPAEPSKWEVAFHEISAKLQMLMFKNC